ncbi:ClpXP protease specificity-enhancing factor SspB [Bosea sp. 117]|uniref:SspB family protein n=1 Tax=Bosea sp. 117 TaxID=1125973 RepID=UPI00049413D6|nr:ClpXP protease specificity-enhancing factor SspB [Bosea sp. 117]
MSVDLIRYDLLVQDALRDVVRRVLSDVARDGLQGDHHLFISFDTRAPGVRLSSRLKEDYPDKMTIVLQHQFWDLIVTEQFFEVGLSFKRVPERLHVPFSALKEFYDPSVKFGLQFEPSAEDADAPASETASEASPSEPVGGPARPTSVPSTGPTRLPERAGPSRPAELKPVEARPASKASAEAEPPAESVPEDAEPPSSPAGGAQVVRLDTFRKK